MLSTGCHYWHTTAQHVLCRYGIRLFSESIDHSETIIFSMYHRQSGAAGSNRYSWIRWSCPHATCQRVTNNRVAAHYSLTSLRGWQLAFIHIYAPLSSACFFSAGGAPGHLETKKNPLCVCARLVWSDKGGTNLRIDHIFAFIFEHSLWAAAD